VIQANGATKPDDAAASRVLFSGRLHECSAATLFRTQRVMLETRQTTSRLRLILFSSGKHYRCLMTIVDDLAP
jgi:hypothetical protein